MRQTRTIFLIDHLMFVAVFVFATGCGGENTRTNVQAPGGNQPARETVLEAGADLMQDKHLYKPLTFTWTAFISTGNYQ